MERRWCCYDHIVPSFNIIKLGMVANGGLTADRIEASKQIKSTLGMVANGGLTADTIKCPNVSGGITIDTATITGKFGCIGEDPQAIQAHGTNSAINSTTGVITSTGVVATNVGALIAQVNAITAALRAFGIMS